MLDPRLPGPMEMNLTFEGDWVQTSTVDFGFTTRNLENKIQKARWDAGPLFASKIDPEAGFFGEQAFVMALENVMGITCDPSTEFVRTIFSELSRVSAHLRSVAYLSRVVSIDTAFHYLLREREKILDLFELATGSRFTCNICRPGGMNLEVTQGFLERVLFFSENLLKSLPEYHLLLTENRSFKKRTQNKGVLSVAEINELGLNGLIPRSAGVVSDLRISKPYSAYREVKPTSVICPESICPQGSDTYSRFWIKMVEIQDSLELLIQLVEKSPRQQEKRVTFLQDLLVHSGSGMAEVETQRGVLKVEVSSRGESTPLTIKINTPSQLIAKAIPVVLKNTREEDLSLILQGLDFSVLEIDL